MSWACSETGPPSSLLSAKKGAAASLRKASYSTIDFGVGAAAAGAAAGAGAGVAALGSAEAATIDLAALGILVDVGLVSFAAGLAGPGWQEIALRASA